MTVRHIICAIALVACDRSPQPVAPATTPSFARESHVVASETFTPNDTTISTSEGAPYGFCNFWVQGPAVCTNLKKWGYGPTRVIQTYICLSGDEVSINNCSQQPAVTGPISRRMLRDMDARIAAYEGTGVRLLVRFTYNFGPIGAMDAPIDVIARHIDQVAPVLLRHRNVVFALESGFIGTWGEWHNSTNGNDTATVHKAVLDKERAYFGGVFPILVRDAGELVQFTGDLTPRRDFGLHDDFYASSATDAGTWQPCNPAAGYCLTGYTTPQLETYGADIARTTMFAGEFAGPAVYPPLQQCDSLFSYSYRYHVQSIGLDAPAAVAAELQAEGCLLSFYNRVGTRLELQHVTITAANRVLTLDVTLANTGFGRVIRRRPARLVFLSNKNVLATFPVEDIDVRNLDGVRTYRIQVRPPAASGPITVALDLDGLPLNSVNQSGQPVFDRTTGYNVISDSFPLAGAQ